MTPPARSRSRAVRYARYGGPEVLELVERDDPRPGPGQVRLTVRAASVNPFDAKLRQGLLARSEAPEIPVVPGTDVAGVVEAAGEGAGLEIGDEVLGRADGGAYAEKALAEATELVVKPAAMSWEVAGSMEVIVHTAHSALAPLDLRPGETLLVHGASGAIGTIAVQLARERGLVVVGTASTRHHAALEALGVTPVAHGDGLGDRVRAATARQGSAPAVDAVLDLAGRGALAELVAVAGGPDRVVTVAHPDAPRHGVRFVGRTRVPGALADAVDAVVAGRLRMPATTTYPLDAAARAQEDNRTGAVSGKLVLVP